MRLEPSTVLILSGICMQAFALAALFVWTGIPIIRRNLPSDANRPLPLSFVYAGGFFLGLATFLILFVLLSRVLHSVHFGLGVSFAVMVALPFVLRSPADTPRTSWRVHAGLIVALLGLFGIMVVTAATCWLYPGPEPSHAPTLMHHFGSIHSGRYATYGIYMVEHDRIPYLAQNMGQSILTGVHLLLGVNAPLVALTTWIGVALAALTCLVFGFFRWNGLSNWWALSGAFFVLYCNIAVSLVSVFLLDNGSPLAFAGYSDVVVGVATYLLACAWFRTFLLDPTRRVGLMPFALGVLWCWCAPQNVPVGIVAMSGTGLVWLWHSRENRWPLFRRLGTAGLLFAAALAVGATQLGTFLPKSMQEDAGVKVFVPATGFRVRPYIQYYRTLWSNGRSNMSVPAARGTEMERASYAEHFENPLPTSHHAQFNGICFLIETHFWASMRIYGYLVLGIGLLAWRFRCHAAGPDAERFRVWFWLALGSFVPGYLVAFGLELGEMKWWLTRFLVPAVIVCLTGFVLAMAPSAGNRSSWGRKTVWSLIVVAATWGPLFEFYQWFGINWIIQGRVDPAAHRLNLLAHTTGPFEDKPMWPVKPPMPPAPKSAPAPTTPTSPPPDRASTQLR